ncbi:MAG: metalloregulator ArsR/SmtB family transcription factor [Wenzhouxiangellaceae bacterium]|nr:metalloregulator ArsR/SmtB family transcription factor [Wenzhouxiangellaceae bacterium]
MKVMNLTPKNSSQLNGMTVPEMARHADDAAQFLKMMANPHRLMILCHLLEGEMSVSNINRHLPLSQSALSQHLAVLRNRGMVSTRRDQQTIYYDLANDGIEAIIGQLYSQFCQPPELVAINDA